MQHKTSTRSSIKIQDIIVINHKREGEFNSSQWVKNPDFPKRKVAVDSGEIDNFRVQRMSGYIEHLARYAAYTHKTSLSQHQGTFEIISRIVLDEYHLYTQDRPLNMHEYRQLIENIHVLAKTLPPNIHLQIATMAVDWPNGVTQNCALYVQSPRQTEDEPVIHHLIKRHSSSVDLQYAYKEYDPLTQEIKYVFKPLVGDDPFLDASYEKFFSVMLQGTKIRLYDVNQYQGALKIITADKQEFLQVIDICYDHLYGQGVHELLLLIEQLQGCSFSVPLMCSHIISAKSVPNLRKYSSATITQADILTGSVGELQPLIISENEIESLVSERHGGFGRDASYRIFPLNTVGLLRKHFLKKIIAMKAKIGIQFNVNEQDEAGKTYLHLEIENALSQADDTLERVRYLKDSGATMGIKDSNGQSARDLLIDLYELAMNEHRIFDALCYVQIADVLGILSTRHHLTTNDRYVYFNPNWIDYDTNKTFFYLIFESLPSADLEKFLKNFIFLINLGASIDVVMKYNNVPTTLRNIIGSQFIYHFQKMPEQMDNIYKVLLLLQLADSCRVLAQIYASDQNLFLEMNQHYHHLVYSLLADPKLKNPFFVRSMKFLADKGVKLTQMEYNQLLELIKYAIQENATYPVAVYTKIASYFGVLTQILDDIHPQIGENFILM